MGKRQSEAPPPPRNTQDREIAVSVPVLPTGWRDELTRIRSHNVPCGRYQRPGAEARMTALTGREWRGEEKEAGLVGSVPELRPKPMPACAHSERLFGFFREKAQPCKLNKIRYSQQQQKKKKKKWPFPCFRKSSAIRKKKVRMTTISYAQASHFCGPMNFSQSSGTTSRV
jgi:hypothetical protein